MDVIDRTPSLGSRYATLRQRMVDKRIAAREYTRTHGDDIPEVRDWVWPTEHAQTFASDAVSSTGGDND
jgi:xylulose-5-phosphate/fructose-6-phosphate phosphoketolase